MQIKGVSRYEKSIESIRYDVENSFRRRVIDRACNRRRGRRTCMRDHESKLKIDKDN